jgi:mRNA interferase MazF
LKRGEVRTVAGGPDYVGKPRPAVVIQEEMFDVTDSVTICAFTTTRLDAPTFRLQIEPTTLNGLERRSWLMVDKVSSVPRTKMGRRLGRLEAEDVSRLNQALLVFLGLARPVARS